MQNVKKISICLLLLVQAFFISAQKEIIVSEGTDLVSVRDQVRTMNDNMTEDIIVKLAGGNYILSQTLKFTEEDSASNGFRIIWRNVENELPRISGGVKITSWQDEGNGIISASVKERFKFRQLYVNDRKAKRAKFLDGTGKWARVYYNDSGKYFYLPKADAVKLKIASWSQIENVELNVVSTFVGHQPKLDSISSDDTYTYLFVAEPTGTILSDVVRHFDKSDDGSIKYPYDVYFENAYEFLDEPGEWYHDEKNHKVFYKLKPGESVTNVSIVAPSLNALLEISGSNNLVFYGLVFEHSNWTRPSKYGFSSIQNLYRVPGGSGNSNNMPIPAAINISNSKNILMERNIIRYTGGTGIMAFDNCLQHLALVGNLFYQTASSALQLGDDDKKGAISPQEGIYQPLVSNNVFYKCGVQYSSPIVFCTYPYQLDFSHNEILYGQTMGLNVGWGGLNTSDLLYRPLVEYNKFDSVARVGSDVSVYHTRNTSKGARIAENWFDHSIKSVEGRITGRYNVSYNDPKWGNIYIDNDARDNNIIGNIHTNFSSNGYDGGRDGHYIFGDKDVPNYIIDYSDSSEIYRVKDNAGLIAQYEDIKDFLHEGSIGGSGFPIEHPFVTYLVDDRDKLVYYSGKWSQQNNVGTDVSSGSYISTYTQTTTDNDFAEITFEGVGLEVFGPTVEKAVKVDLYMDSVFQKSIVLQGNNEWQKIWYHESDLKKGQHTLKIVKVGGAKLNIDGFKIIQSKELVSDHHK